MTSQKIKFYKFNSSSTSAEKITTAKATEGAVIYLVDARELWIGGSTPKLVIKGANDVTFANNVLTLTHYDNTGAATTQTLDFSDVASASQTMTVFQQIYTKMGLTGNNHDTIDYSETNYLSDLGTTGHPDKNLVNADKALDAAIHNNTTMAADSAAVYDTEHLSSTWTTVVNANEIEAGDAVTADVEKLDKKVAGLADEVIANEQVTQEAFTTVANSVGLEQDMSLDLSNDTTGIIQDDTNVKAALQDLANAISTNQLDVQVDGATIVSNHIANINTEDTYNASTNKLATKATVTNAINALDVNEYEQASVNVNTTNHTSTLKIKGIKEVGGKIAAATTTPTSDVAIDGEYDATDNKIATKSTVTNAINNLNVNTDKGAASISGSTITINAVQQENGLIKDGTSTTINLDGTYDATDNKIATKSTVTSAIEALNTTNDVQAVDYTAATSSTGAKLTFKGVSETDGVIAQGTGTTELQFAKVATTGAASDVSYTNTTSGMTATDVQAAIDELDGRVDSLVGGMRYNGNINSATATLNTTTRDIRPGDIYLASGAFTIGETSVEAGDMIVYKGAKSSSAVPLDNNNCTIIERETDTMVTAGDTLTDDYIVFGSGNKEVSVTSTVDSDNYQVSAATLKDAITKANSALQSISHGTDGTYVTTTVGSKDSNNRQTVGVEVTQSTVTYTAKDGDTPANLTATNGLLNESAITPIKNYVDAKVGTAIQSVDASAAEKDKSVTQSDYATVKVSATTDANNNVTLDSAVGLPIQAVSASDPSSAKGLAEASDVKSYVDGVVNGLDVTEYAQASVTAANGGTTITVKGIKEENGEIGASTNSADTPILADGEYNDSTNKLATQSTVTNAINNLNANPTSDDAAVAKVQVVETNGVITDVVVTNNAAGVSYTASTASTQPGLSATTSTGAVTGADIATIKSYIDDKSEMCWEAYE